MLFVAIFEASFDYLCLFLCETFFAISKDTRRLKGGDPAGQGAWLFTTAATRPGWWIGRWSAARMQQEMQPVLTPNHPSSTSLCCWRFVNRICFVF